MTNLLTLNTVCSIHKKPCTVVGINGLKKVIKECCNNEVINLSSSKGIEIVVINGVIHI